MPCLLTSKLHVSRGLYIIYASGTLFLVLSPGRDLRVFCTLNSGKVRYPNEKAPSAYITRQPERESAILVDPPRAKANNIFEIILNNCFTKNQSPLIVIK